MPINLPDGTQVKQRQVYKSASVSDNLAVPTLSYASQKSLEDDLNYLRSILKQIKGTTKYDSPLSSSLEALYQELQEAVFHNAELTGTPRATDIIPPGDYSDRLSTTQFVSDTVNAYLSGQPGDARYVHTQNATPPLVVKEVDGKVYNFRMWYVTHNLGKFPSVTVINSADQVVSGLVEYEDNTDTPSQNALKIYFTSPELGKAYLN